MNILKLVDKRLRQVNIRIGIKTRVGIEMMKNLNLDMDESIILEADDVQKIGQAKEDLEELILTNKNLIFVEEKKNGFFVKPTMEITKVSLSEIKIFNGQAQATLVKNSEYGICLQVQFIRGREFFVFENSAKKTTIQWKNEINRVLLGCIPTEIQTKTKQSSFGSLSGIASNLKTVSDSARQTISTTTRQVVDLTEKSAVQHSSIERPYQKEVASTNEYGINNISRVGFCSNCGFKIKGGTKFCQECGNPISKESIFTSPILPVLSPSDQQMENAQRYQEYAGKILKCPNCGAVINQTTAICPECGLRITGQLAVNSVQSFKDQLMLIENTRRKGIGSMFNVGVDAADIKKLSLIRSFPIPNSIDDILEFMLLAIANIDVGLSKNTAMNKLNTFGKTMETNATIGKTLSDAWVGKMQQAYQKAELSFPNDPMFINIQKMYLDKMKELKIKVS